MIKILLVQNYIKKNNVIYSLDMIRLRFVVKNGGSYQDIYEKKFLDYAQGKEVYNLGDFYYTTSRGVNKYRHMFTYKNRAYTVKMLYSLNSAKEYRYSGYIEFNPNKVSLSVIKIFLYGMLDFLKNHDGIPFKLDTFDMAVDLLNVERSDVLLYKDRRSYHLIDNRGARTEYLGVHNQKGFIKLYDKQSESRLDFPCTRIEITFKENLDITFPEIYYRVVQKNINFDLNSTYSVLLDLLQGLDESEIKIYWRRLSNNIRNKLRPYLYNNRDKFEFDMECVSCIYEYARKFQDLSISIDESAEDEYFEKRGFKIFRNNPLDVTMFDLQYYEDNRDKFHEPRIEDEVYMYENAFKTD